LRCLSDGNLGLQINLLEAIASSFSERRTEDITR
jgi:hypothetical protein